jgi:hypothetical protein
VTCHVTLHPGDEEIVSVDGEPSGLSYVPEEAPGTQGQGRGGSGEHDPEERAVADAEGGDTFGPGEEGVWGSGRRAEGKTCLAGKCLGGL